MKRCLLPMLVVLGWAVTSETLAEDNPTTRLSLKGLEAVAVSAQPISPAAEKDGLSEKLLEETVATRLRRAGIGLLGPQELLDDPRRPRVSVSVITARLDTGEYLYSVRLELVQWVASLDDPTLRISAAIPVPASTWSPAGVLGITPTDLLKQDVEAAVAAMTDQFIEALGKANPRRTAMRNRSLRR